MIVYHNVSQFFDFQIVAFANWISVNLVCGFLFAWLALHMPCVLSNARALWNRASCQFQCIYFAIDTRAISIPLFSTSLIIFRFVVWITVWCYSANLVRRCTTILWNTVGRGSTAGDDNSRIVRFYWVSAVHLIIFFSISRRRWLDRGNLSHGDHDQIRLGIRINLLYVLYFLYSCRQSWPYYICTQFIYAICSWFNSGFQSIRLAALALRMFCVSVQTWDYYWFLVILEWFQENFRLTSGGLCLSVTFVEIGRTFRF
jgi:hypothetical protein